MSMRRPFLPLLVLFGSLETAGCQSAYDAFANTAAITNIFTGWYDSGFEDNYGYSPRQSAIPSQPMDAGRDVIGPHSDWR
jgi:hypothetical protein